MTVLTGAGALALVLAGCSQPAETDGTAAGDNTMTELAAGEGMAEEGVMVGGAAMLPSKTVVENASNASNLTTLVAAVKAAGLAETLSGPGPFTVFAPDNEAFKKLPAGTVDTLVKPESKEQLTAILTYHVVPARLSAADLGAAIDQDGGTHSLKTVAGGTLVASRDGDAIVLTDAKGGKSRVSQADVFQSNGVAHVIDTVLMPK